MTEVRAAVIFGMTDQASIDVYRSSINTDNMDNLRFVILTPVWRRIDPVTNELVEQITHGGYINDYSN